MLQKNKIIFILLSFLIVSLGRVYASELPDFKDLSKRLRSSVVSITVERKLDKNSQNAQILEHLFRRGAPGNDDEYQAPAVAQGSGFVISSDGYILTNRHVVDEAKKVTVFMADRREYVAKIIGTDEGTDVAVLKIDADNLTAVKTGNSSDLEPGEWVLGIGAPFGFDHTVTAGIVSAKRRTLPGELYVPFIQTDVAINPGNSGGPLVDMKGQVVGINSQIFSRSGGFMGISFSIPIELATGVADQLKKNGQVRRGYLGVSYQDVDYKMAKSFGMREVNGALLTQISKDSPAEKGGLKEQDVILKVNGNTIERAADLPFLIGQTLPDEKVNLLIWRDGKSKSMSVKVGERPNSPEESEGGDADSSSNALGLQLQDLTEEQQKAVGDKGVLVISLENGPAAEAGIRRGDVILSVDREETGSVKEFEKIIASLKPGSDVPVMVQRARVGRRIFLISIPE
ncbi:MAG: hypothetical protein COW84_06775 [Gammaproteobacteria bacterium CG22_combo_CG10-13_8_21_14_all_40_8]|nr:MAG: hypothetical protein COW84_06775 [Gammaproteobacteria bacterium CG22_combo_CG10-13_8_21_14_all_40_8]